MEIIPLHVQDVTLLQVARYNDDRGYLQELFNMEKYPDHVTKCFPVLQVTCSVSKKNVIRGLHVSTYCKLVTCNRGSLYDVVVDLRPDSMTFLQWTAAILSSDNHRQMFIPPGCGHGFLALEDDTMMVYAQGGCFRPTTDHGISPFDPSINVYWPIPEQAEPIISAKDRNADNYPVDPNIQLHHAAIRLLVIGASGQVGQTVVSLAKRDYAEVFKVIGTFNSATQPCSMKFDLERAAKDSEYCDILLTATNRPSVVVLAGAYTHVDGCENNKDKSQVINSQAVTAIREACQRFGAKMVFLSTNYVFDKNVEINTDMVISTKDSDVAITEDSTAHPLNVYGQCKREAEKAALMCEDNLVIRTCNVYGPEDSGKNFTYRIVEQCQKENDLTCAGLEVVCPTYSRDLARGILELVRLKKCGLYHICGPEAYSRFQWATRVAKHLNLKTERIIQTDAQDNTSPFVVATRPQGAILSVKKISKEMPSLALRPVEEALDDWLKSPNGKPLIKSTTN